MYSSPAFSMGIKEASERNFFFSSHLLPPVFSCTKGEYIDRQMIKGVFCSTILMNALVSTCSLYMKYKWFYSGDKYKVFGVDSKIAFHFCIFTNILRINSV